jgi:ribosomal protein S18 acetylase RimI-like enzyme
MAALQALTAHSEYEVSAAELGESLFNAEQIALSRERVEHKVEQSWLAEHPFSKIIGYATVRKLLGEKLISGLHVFAGFENIGIENRLLTSALEWFRYEPPISVQVPVPNEERIRFYEELGFHQDRSCTIAELPDGRKIPGVVLVFAT